VITIDDPACIGGIISDLRLMGMLSQRQLCAEVGMQQARLSDWECGRAMPSIPYLVPVLGVLGYRLVITTEADA
jgi:transcriptional regulator with XRE-family HTH domain